MVWRKCRFNLRSPCLLPIFSVAEGLVFILVQYCWHNVLIPSSNCDIDAGTLHYSAHDTASSLNSVHMTLPLVNLTAVLDTTSMYISVKYHPYYYNIHLTAVLVTLLPHTRHCSTCDTTSSYTSLQYSWHYFLIHFTAVLITLLPYTLHCSTHDTTSSYTSLQYSWHYLLIHVTATLITLLPHTLHCSTHNITSSYTSLQYIDTTPGTLHCNTPDTNPGTLHCNTPDTRILHCMLLQYL